MAVNLELGTPVEWLGHPGVFVVLERTNHTVLLREWGNADGKLLHTMVSELRPLTEDAAIERVRDNRRQQCT